MEKNYNYNYINRKSVKKSDIEFNNVETASCTSVILKKSPVTNGRLWHTTDTNEFFYDWDGKRNKLNLTGDSAAISSEIEKIKSDVAKLNPSKMDQLENKVNQAVSRVNGIESSVNEAIANAEEATARAEEAAASVEGKADKSYVDDAVAGLASKSDIPDVSDFATKSEIPSLDDYAKKSEIPDVSDFASKSDIPDVSDFASKSDIPDVSDFASKSDIPDLTDYATKSDLENLGGLSDEDRAKIDSIPANIATKDDLVDFLSGSDLDGYVKADDIKDFITEEALEDLASKSDLEGYVKVEDVTDYLTASDLDDYLKVSELPTNVSAFINDAGYITAADLPEFLTGSDLDDYVKADDVKDFVKAETLENLASKSDLEGYVKTEDTIEFLTVGDLDDYAKKSDIPDVSDLTPGSFPAGSDVEDEQAEVDGFATVQDVMDYVNTLIEKKNWGSVGDGKDYIYINGLAYEDEIPTPTPIYQMNCYEITDDALNSEGMVLRLIVDNEKVGMEGEGDATIENYSQVLTVDIPEGYTFEIYGWNPIGSTYSNAMTEMISNPRGATKQYGNKVYNSYIRRANDLYYDVLASSTRYKIIIRKNN